MWNRLTSHSTCKKSKRRKAVLEGRKHLKALVAFEFMQMSSLIDRLGRMRLYKIECDIAKSHSKSYMSHSTAKKLIATFIKINGILIFLDSTFEKSNAILNRSHSIMKYRMRHKICRMRR